MAIASRLTRITTSGRFMPEVDGLRFLAIAMVVVYHLDDLLRDRAVPTVAAAWTRTWTSRVAQQGHFGVPLFFVLSGFILSLPFALHRLRGAPPVRLGAFFLRRVTRLEPPYLLSLVARATLLFAVGRTSLAAGLPHLAASMLYLHNVAFGAMSTISIVAWSLEIEVEFYLLAPAFAAIFLVRSARTRRALLLGAIIGAALVQAAWPHPDPRAELSLLWYVQYFLAGILLTDVYVADWQQAPRPHAIADALGIAALVGILAVGYTATAPGLLIPFLTLVLYGAVFRGRALRSAATWPPTVLLGGMCYTIYLWHYGVIGVAARATRAAIVPGNYALSLALQLCLTGAVLLAVTVLLFVAVERPCMRRDWPQRLWRRITRRPDRTDDAPGARSSGAPGVAPAPWLAYPPNTRTSDHAVAVEER